MILGHKAYGPKILAPLLAAGTLVAGLAMTAAAQPKKGVPIVIGHRGASGYRPEHTLAAYALAIEQGADYVEPDLVMTKDKVLVARHENEISGTTDVADRSEFAGRKTTKTIDGAPVTGWFTEDFTLRELKTLRAKERIPQARPGNAAFDGQFPVPTLQEVISPVRRKEEELNRRIGIYPETKQPTYFDSIGLSVEETHQGLLHANGYTKKTDPVFIQSFEVGNLKDLHRRTRLRLAQLLNDTGRPYDFAAAGDPRTYADLATPAGLKEIKRYADGVGVNKNLILPRDAQNRLLRPTSLIRDAHRAGLVVHAWTLRNENFNLPADFRAGDPAHPAFPALRGRVEAEYELLYRLGVDGVFSDNPDTAVGARTALLWAL